MGSAVLVQPMRGCLRDLKPEQFPTAKAFSRIEWWIIVVVNYFKGKADPELREKCMTSWVRHCFEILKPFIVSESAGAENESKQYWDEEQGNTIMGNKERLAQIKNEFDPDNFFKHNRNVKPTAHKKQ
mmetsp:Transcript_22884/g.63662  ORF Transcript_22884/g.63662 Transcript_22884/m.63662 type:complete len:128 (+) Transcript_22884:1197-1580(+)